jgi:hypothetical protein
MEFTKRVFPLLFFPRISPVIPNISRTPRPQSRSPGTGFGCPRILDEFGALRVEAIRFIVLGVDENRRDANGLRGDCDTAERVREDVGAQPLAGVAAADREPPDQRDFDRVGPVAPELSRRGRAFY